ncbi:MAG TPA: glycoside hydrolase family 2 TIM barrel-domain containing protein [Terriglobales bacterium]|nr:glycoside hydrolase family 2 TIM barrel-domain containing protein [Terriglobales bacterium]
MLAQAPRPDERGPIVLVNVDHRKTTTLNGEWRTIVDPYATGLFDFHGRVRKDGYFLNQRKEEIDGPLEYDFQKSATLRVPGDWNTQRESLFLYEGVVWYQKDFDYQPKPGWRVFFHVGAANYRSFVWVNGMKACEHEGGFTAFDCEITNLVRHGGNFVVVAVDSTRLADGAPTTQTDWWNYGGLTRDVSLVEVPERFIDDYSLQLKRGTKTEIEGWVHVDGAEPGTAVTVTIPEQRVSQTSKVEADGRARFQLHAANLELWSPEKPKLYKLEVSAGDDKLEDEVGFRTIEVRGTQILLNGKPIFLRGISVHAEAPYRTGRAYSDQDAKTLLGWVQELGGNFVRLAHYPHDERMTRWADRMGVLIWSEIPVYWACQFDNPAVLAKAKQQLEEMISRDRNKASVVLWSVANETPASAARTAFLETLVARTRELDPSRLVTAALLVWGEKGKKIVNDPLGKSLDVIGINEYIGWYEQTPEAADRTEWDIRVDKPVIVSEFGGDAKFGLHGAPSQRWTEEYQANIYEHQLAMINRIPQVRGLSPWILMDFRSPRRPLPGVQDFFNRKGLLSDQGDKKKAFFVLQKAYKERTVGKAE